MSVRAIVVQDEDGDNVARVGLDNERLAQGMAMGTCSGAS